MLKIYNESDGIHPVGNLDNGIIPAEPKLTITVEELAQQLNVSRTTAYNLARRKDFYPAFRIGHRMIISRQALSRWLDDQTEVS
ncbi:MAG: helix-turn-helix domain-containing protein [Clostridiales bacterium]|nr:helix-turn-helix domain-containing protein [Clostridiales bacterium]